MSQFMLLIAGVGQSNCWSAIVNKYIARSLLLYKETTPPKNLMILLFVCGGRASRIFDDFIKNRASGGTKTVATLGTFFF